MARTRNKRKRKNEHGPIPTYITTPFFNDAFLNGSPESSEQATSSDNVKIKIEKVEKVSYLPESSEQTGQVTSFDNVKIKIEKIEKVSEQAEQVTSSNDVKVKIEKVEKVSVATQTDDIMPTAQNTIINSDYSNYSHVNADVYPVPQVPKLPKTFKEKESTRRLIILLDNTCLENCEITNSQPQYQLLNCDQRRKGNYNMMNYRPDITHQCLMSLLDSPLSKVGLMQVYIHFSKKVLIEVNPHFKIPRDFENFSKLMGRLLGRSVIHEGNEVLLRMIRNPVITRYLPTKCVKLALSCDGKPVRLSEYLPTIPPDHSICVAVGAMVHGRENFADNWVDERIVVSQYPHSAAVACSIFCNGLASFWGVL